MGFFRKLREKYYETLNMYRQISLDRKYRKEYLSIIREQCADPKSSFVKNNLKLGDDGESVCYVTNIPAELQTTRNDFMIYEKLNENTYFMTEFLKKEAGFGNYITLPQYFHIEDPSSDDISVLYLAVWRFNPMIYPSLKRKALEWLYGSLAAIMAGLCAGAYFILF